MVGGRHLLVPEILDQSDPPPSKTVTGWLKLQEWTLQEWTMTEHVSGVDIAGVDNDGVNRRGGHCRSGQ